jgi:acetyl esterase/lipase
VGALLGLYPSFASLCFFSCFGCVVCLDCWHLHVCLQVAYDQLSPLHAARNPAPSMSQFMPPVLLLHGTTDKTVPVASSLLMNDALHAAGVDTQVGTYACMQPDVSCFPAHLVMSTQGTSAGNAAAGTSPRQLC